MTLPTTRRRRVLIVLAGTSTVVLAVLVVFLLFRRSSPGHAATGKQNQNTPPSQSGQSPPPILPPKSVPSPQATPPAASYNVVSYGADPGGVKDSALAIRRAIAEAERAPGRTVYFPSGRYVLDLNDGAKQDFSIATNPIVIMGAGRESTTIVEEIGAKTAGVTTSKAIFQIASGANGEAGGGDGTVITGLTLDSASYDAGTTIMDFGNGTAIGDMTIRGARSNKQYNRDTFGLRVITICSHDNLATKHRSGNRVDNIVLSGQGFAGNTDLDLSCQINSSVSNITDTGNGMDIYICKNIDVTNFTFTPGTIEASPKSYVITGPSDNIALDNVTTNGSGGQLRPSPNGYLITNTTITNEKMNDLTSDLVIGDASGTRIIDSTIGILRMSPTHALNGLTLTNSTVRSVTCGKRGAVTALVGVQC